MAGAVCLASGERRTLRLLSASCASPMERIVEMIPQAIDGLRAMGEDETGSLPKGKDSYRVSAAYQE